MMHNLPTGVDCLGGISFHGSEREKEREEREEEIVPDVACMSRKEFQGPGVTAAFRTKSIGC